jgi:hypothetical protein
MYTEKFRLPAKGKEEVEMPKTQPRSLGLSANLDNVLVDHLALIKKQIIEKAQEIARPSASSATEGESVEVDVASLKNAIDDVIKGERKNRFFDLFPPFTVVCFVLCLAFGFLGFFPKTAGGGYLDVAKIFAGAIVGSTSVALSRAKRAR